MDLHVYRNSQDRWHDLRSVARECGAVLALNAVTLEELVERLTPDLKAATAGQRLALLAHSPPRRGGVAAPAASGLAAQTGWSDRAKYFGLAFKRLLVFPKPHSGGAPGKATP